MRQHRRWEYVTRKDGTLMCNKKYGSKRKSAASLLRTVAMAAAITIMLGINTITAMAATTYPHTLVAASGTKGELRLASYNGYTAVVEYVPGAGDETYTRMRFPVWTASGGQDDIVWYEGIPGDNGIWRTTVDLLDHAGRDTSNTTIQAYGTSTENASEHIIVSKAVSLSSLDTSVEGFPVGLLPVGTEVTLTLDGYPVQFIVVQQGIPHSEGYDETSNGTWLLMKDAFTQLNGASIKSQINTRRYEDSQLHANLNSVFIEKFTEDVQNNLMEVNLPVLESDGGGGGRYKAGGIQAKAFALGAAEVVCPGSAKYTPGSHYYYLPGRLEHFDQLPSYQSWGEDDHPYLTKRANNTTFAHSDTNTAWVLRQPFSIAGQSMSSDNVYMINADGDCVYFNNRLSNISESSTGVRPCIVLPKNTSVAPDGAIDGTLVTSATYAADELPVGSIVNINVSGEPTSFIVANQGRPNRTQYDEAAAGTWLVAEYLLDEPLTWSSGRPSGTWSDYPVSGISDYLNSSYLYSLEDDAVQNAVRTVRIPVQGGTFTESCAPMPSTKIYILSGCELGYTTINGGNIGIYDGSTLKYYSNIREQTGLRNEVRSRTYAHLVDGSGYLASYKSTSLRTVANQRGQRATTSTFGYPSTDASWISDGANTDAYIQPAMVVSPSFTVSATGALVTDEDAPDIVAEPSILWSSDGATVSLSITDNGGTGVTEVAYKLSTDDSYTILWSGVEDVVETSFTATQNGTYNIRVLDAAGNEGVQNVQVNSIDRDAPGMTYTRTPESWASGSVTISLNVTDADSGVAEVSYKKVDADVFTVLWSGEQNSVNTSLTATEISEYVVKYLDVAGNEATENIQIDKLDNAAPSFVYATDPPQGQRTMETVAVTIAATDSGTPGVDRSGIGEIWYKHASDAEYTLAWSCEDEDGPASHTISFEVADNGLYSIKIVDMAGNQTVDTVSVENITDEVHAGEIPSGLVDPEYSLNNGSTWQTAPDGEATVSVSDGDNYAVRGRSVTGSGMRSDPSGAIPVSIDMQLPIVQAVTRPDAARSSTITVIATDTQSGVYKICVSKNGGMYEDLFTAAVGTTESSVYSKTIDYRVTSNGTYTFKAIDVVGNESLPQAAVINTIDREPPVIEDGIPQLVELSGDSSYAVIHLVGRDVGSSGFSHFVLPDGTQSVNTTVNYRVSESGTYTFHAFDNAGNSASRTVMVSGVRPSSDTSISVTMRTAANYTWDKYTAIGQIADNAIRIPYKESNAVGDISGTYCRTYNADPYAYPSGGTDPIEWEDETYPHNYTEELESYRGKWVEINGQMYYIESDAALGDDGNWWYVYGKVVTPQRGSFFNTVSAVTEDAYPENGYLDGYWYTAKPDSSTTTLSNGSDMDFYLNTEGQNDVTMTFACSNAGAKISMFNDEVLNENTHTVHFDIAPNQTVNFTLTVKAVDGSEDSYIVRVHTKNMIPTVRVVNERQINRSVYAETGYAYQSEFVPYGDSTYGIDGVVFEILATDKNVGQFVSGYVTFQGLNYSIQWGEAPNSGVTSYGSKGTEQKGFAIIPSGAFSGEGKKDINELIDVVVQDSQTSGGEVISRSNAMSTNVRLHTDVTAPEISCEMYSTRYALKVRVSDTTSVPHITVTLTPKNGGEPTVLNLTQSELNNAIALTAGTEFDVSIEAVDLCGHVGTLNGTTTYVPPRFIPEGGSGDGGEGGTGGSGSGEGGSGSGIPGVDSDFWRIVGENHGISGFQTRNGTYLIINPAGDTRQSNPRTNGHEQNFGLFGNEQ